MNDNFVLEFYASTKVAYCVKKIIATLELNKEIPNTLFDSVLINCIIWLKSDVTYWYWQNYLKNVPNEICCVSLCQSIFWNQWIIIVNERLYIESPYSAIPVHA